MVSSITKEALAQLSQEKFPGRIIVIQSESEAEKACQYLKQYDRIGFDTETRPAFKKGVSNKIALMQLSTDDTCFLFRLNIIDMPDCLANLLTDPAIRKIGLSLKDDFSAIRKRAPLIPGSFVELQTFVKQYGIEKVSQNNVLHFLNNGTAKLMFSHNKSMSYVPICLILKCLVDYSDEQIYRHLIRGLETNQYYVTCIQAMLRDVHGEGLHTHKDCKDFLGQMFHPRLHTIVNSDEGTDITDFILKELILIHLSSNKDKFNLLVFMVQKLFQTAEGKYKVENVDAVMMQELLLPGTKTKISFLSFEY